MSSKAEDANKKKSKSRFSLLNRKKGDPSSKDPSEPRAPVSSSHSKDGLYNFGVALDLLRAVGEGNELLAPLKAACSGLKVLVDTAQAMQQNDEDLRDLNDRLRRQLQALEQQNETLSAAAVNNVHNDVEGFVASLRTYILDLTKVQDVLVALQPKEEGRTSKFLKKVWTVNSMREEIKGCNRQLDESFQLFMHSVTGFIAHQAVLLRNDVADIRVKQANDAISRLPCSDARGNQHGLCLEGTRGRILKEISDWAADCEKRPVFCLVDQAGTGKSTISAQVAQKWGGNGFITARFFFSLPQSVTTATNLATTLARDMADTGPTLCSHILQAINDHPNITGYSIQETLDWFVFGPLKQRRDDYLKVLDDVRKTMREKSPMKLPKSLHEETSKGPTIKALKMVYAKALERVRQDAGNKTYMEALGKAYSEYMEGLAKVYEGELARPPILVIDALDECRVADRAVLLKSVLGFLATGPVNSRPAKLFVTCRPEADILSQFNNSQFPNLVQQADFGMGVESNRSNHHDIALYADQYLSDVLNSSQISLFVERAAGLFIWASTARKYLEGAFDPSSRFESLMAHNTKGSPLDSLYSEILRSVVERVGSDQVGLLKKVLQSVCVAREPLDTNAMDELLCLGSGVAYRVVTRLRSVLSDGTDCKAVQALHPTFIEYFLARSQPDDLLFYNAEAEVLLASGCLKALCSRQLKYDICGVMRPGEYPPENRDIDELQQRVKENTSSSLRYAAVYGLSHVDVCLQDNVVLRGLQEFLETNLLHWIELMSLLGKIYILMQSVHRLETRIKDGLAGSVDILDVNWCEEIQKLIQPFQATIEESAMQVYFSALPFAPSTSRVSRFYHRRFTDKIPKVLRGTWRADSQPTILVGHRGAVVCVSYSPDGHKVASGSKNSIVRLWDVATGAAVGEPLVGHTDSLTCLSFSPDGRKIASGSWDSTVRLWDVAANAAIGEPLEGHTGPVRCLSFSPDGYKVASGSYDGTVRLWDVATGAAFGEPLDGHTDRVSCLSFSPNSRKVASGSHDGTVRLWDVETGEEIGEPLAGHTGSVRSLSFSPDGYIVASGSHDGTVRLWDVLTGASIGKPLAGHTDKVACLSFSPDGHRVATGSHDGTVRLWNVTTSIAISKPLTGHTGPVKCLSFSPDGHKVASGSYDATVRLWDAATGAAFGEPLAGHTDRATCISFSPDGHKIASGSWDSTVRIWDIADGADIGKPLAGHTSTITCLSFSPNGHKVASGSLDTTIHLWDVATGAAISEPLAGHASWIRCIAFSPDGHRVASGSLDTMVRLWDGSTGVAIGEPLAGHASWVECLSFSPDGHSIASGSEDATVRLWDLATGAAIGEPLVGHTSTVTGLSFSPDGYILASGSLDNTVRLWDTAKGAAFSELLPHPSSVRSLSFQVNAASLFLIIDSSVVWDLSVDPPTRQDDSKPERQSLPSPDPFLSNPPGFGDPWTHTRSPPGIRFRLPSAFQCVSFRFHKGKAAYGGRDGSVIIIDWAHLS